MVPSSPPQLTAACAELARRLRAGEDGRAEDFLQAHPELAAHAQAAQELILTEFMVRRELGQDPDPATWLDRFPHWRESLRILFEMGQGFGDLASPPTRDGTSDFESPPTVATAPAGPAVMRRSTRPARATPASLPEHFGRFRVVGRLGQGGMGSVYLAHDLDLDRRVALKVPQLSYADDPLVERFLREARAVAALEHPNVCPVYEVGEVDGVPYLCMAYLEGRPLSERVREGQSVPQREAAELVRELAEALAYVHGQGVIHRDLKPGNVMFNVQGRPLLVDFGLAVRLTGEDARLTASGAIVGTPAYLAPEQVEGRRDAVGPAVDVYALGVILYELLTGRLPFNGTVGEILVQVARDEPPPPRKHRPDLDAALEQICLKAMAKKAADRYASMEELAADLKAYLDGAPAKRKPRRWLRVAVLAGVTCAGLALAAGLTWPQIVGWIGRPDPNDSVRPKLLPKELTPALLRPLLDDLKAEDVTRREVAATSLMENGVKEAVPDLVQRVGDNLWDGDGPDPSKDAALAALKALGSAEDVTEALTQAARPDRRDTVRRWACARLSEQRGSAMTKVLSGLLRDKDVGVRAEAARGLKRLGDRTAADALAGRVADDDWTKDAGNVDSSKEAALEALRALAPPGRVAEALKSAASSKNVELSGWAKAQLLIE